MELVNFDEEHDQLIFLANHVGILYILPNDYKPNSIVKYVRMLSVENALISGIDVTEVLTSNDFNRTNKVVIGKVLNHGWYTLLNATTIKEAYHELRLLHDVTFNPGMPE